MKIILTLLTSALAVGATLYSGLLHGRIRHEFGLGEDLTEQVRLVKSLPSEFGQTEDGRPAWVIVGEPQALDDDIVDLLECAGHYQAMYRSTLRPDWVVQLLVMVGPPGPLLGHSPAVCYPASGARYLSGPERVEFANENEEDVELQVMLFEQGKLYKRRVKVGYAFSVGENFLSPDNIWMTLGRAPYLYKIQLHCALPPGNEIDDVQDDPLVAFMGDFQLFSD